MSGPRVPPDELAAAVEAFEESGRSLKAAARALGMPHSNLRTRLEIARREGLIDDARSAKAIGQSPEWYAEAQRLVEEHGTVEAAALLGLPRQTLTARLRKGHRSRRPAAKVSEPAPRKSDALGRIADLLERSGIDVDDVGRVQSVRLSEWQGLTKDAEGEAEIHDLTGASVVLSPSWEEGPAWPVVQPGPAVKIAGPRHAPRVVDGWQTAAIVPDMQVGYYWRGEERVPLHDEAAIDVAVQVVRAARPAVIVFVGDNLDLAEFGKYRLTPAFQRTAQATIDRATELLARFRAAAGPECALVYLAGNHEERLPRYILDNARAAFGLRKGGAPESWPVLSVPSLLRFDEIGVEYRPGYPSSEWWINAWIQVVHGAKVNSRGSTAPRYLDRARGSVFYGHVHRIEESRRTRDTRDGPRTIIAASPGCLCSIDGRVPSAKQGTDLDGLPVQSGAEDWQQGIGLVHYKPDKSMHFYESVSITSGWTLWRGREYRAS